MQRFRLSASTVSKNRFILVEQILPDDFILHIALVVAGYTTSIYSELQRQAAI